MVKSTKKLKTMENGEEKTVNVTPIDNSPFSLVEETHNEEKIYFATMGRYKLTENKPTKDEIINEILDVNWNNITRLCMLIVEDNTGKKWNPQR